MAERHRRPDRLAEALRGLGLGLGRTRRAPLAEHDVVGRLDAVERELNEVRARINGLFFAVLTAGLGQLAGQVVL